MDALFEFLATQPLALVVFGTVLALIVGVRYLGLWQGLNSTPDAKAGEARVAAVIVDPTALLAATASVEALVLTLKEAMAVHRSHTAAIDRQSDKIENLTNGVDDLRTEVIRSAAKLK
jgi:hypothetical protein